MKLSQISPSLIPLLASLGNAQQLLPFTINAVNPASLFDGEPVSARGGRFWVGGPPATDCPLPPLDCAPGLVTEFLGTGDHLNVQIMTGQQVYVAPDGALAYTFPGVPTLPPDAFLDPFEVVPNPDGLTSTYRFQYDAFAACPTPEGLQVFAINSPAVIALVPEGPCIPFEAIATTSGPLPAAFVYV